MSIKIGHVLINLVATIKNLDQNLSHNLIEILEDCEIFQNLALGRFNRISFRFAIRLEKMIILALSRGESRRATLTQITFLNSSMGPYYYCK